MTLEIVLLGLAGLTAIGALRIVQWGHALLKKAPWLPPATAGLSGLAVADNEVQMMAAVVAAIALGLFLIWRLLRFIVGHKTLAMLVIVTLTVVCATATATQRAASSTKSAR